MNQGMLAGILLMVRGFSSITRIAMLMPITDALLPSVTLFSISYVLRLVVPAPQRGRRF